MRPRPSPSGATRTFLLPGTLAGREGPASWWVPGWVVLTAVAIGVQACLVWRLLARDPATGTTAAVLSLVCIVAVTVGLVAWQPGRRAGRSWSELPRAVRVQQLSPPVAGLLGLTTLVALSGSGRVLPTVVVVLVWVGAGLAAVSVGRSWRRLRHDLEPTRVEVVLPGLLLVTVLVMLSVLSTPGVSAVHVGKVAAMAGIIGLAVVPAAAIGETSSGVGRLQGYATRVHRITERRPALGLFVLLAKVVLVALVVLAARWLDPSTEMLPSSGPIWLVVAVLGLLALSVLVAERRIGLTVADHRSLARGPGLLVGAGIGGLLVVAVLVVVARVFASVPATAACTTVLVLGCVALGRRGAGRWGYAVALVGGVVGSAVGHHDAPASLPSTLGWARHPVLVLVGAAALVAVLLAVAVRPARRRRLLLVTAVVVAWVLLVTVSGEVARGWTVLDLDLALSAILLVAWVTWRCGWQRRLDGFEVVVAAVVTTLVLEPLPIMDRLVGALVPLALVLAVVAPGVLAVVRLWARASASGGRDRWSDVGRSSTLYGMLLAVVGLTGATSSTTLDRVVELVSGYLLLPLALLLVSATSAARQQPTPAGSNPVSP